MRGVALVLAAGVVAGCGGGSTKASQEEPCGSRDTPAAGATAPAALRLPPEQKLLRVQTQGKTVVAFASTDGGRDDIVTVRDAVLEKLKAQGFTVVGTDQEPGYEAEAEVSGTADGTVRVTPLCEGRLEVRYKIEG